MCGRFTLAIEDQEQLAKLLGAVADGFLQHQYRARYNIAPTDEHWIVRVNREQRELLPAKWGLVNHWSKDAKKAARQINARAESIDTRSAFRDAFKARRCVVPADGYYEWTGAKDNRQPHWFHRPDRGVFLMAGLYESWFPPGSELSTSDPNNPASELSTSDPNNPGSELSTSDPNNLGSELSTSDPNNPASELSTSDPKSKPQRTFTIITTAANSFSAPIHDRMPVILPGEDAIDAWLFGETDPDRLKRLLAPAPDDLLVVSRVSQRANSVKNDDPDLLIEQQALL